MHSLNLSRNFDSYSLKPRLIWSWTHSPNLHNILFRVPKQMWNKFPYTGFISEKIFVRRPYTGLLFKNSFLLEVHWSIPQGTITWSARPQKVTEYVEIKTLRSNYTPKCTCTFFNKIAHLTDLRKKIFHPESLQIILDMKLDVSQYKIKNQNFSKFVLEP